MPRIRSMITAGMLFLTGLLLTGVACAGLIAQPKQPIPSNIPPSVIPLPSDTAAPLFQQVKMQAIAGQEQDPTGSYTISTQTPVLTGSDDPRILSFNTEMDGVVRQAVADFKGNVANLVPTPSSTASTFDLRFNVLSAPGNIISLKFDIQTYYSGAAHPGDVSRTATFDLEHGRDLTLADLFQPNADFLTAVSKYCIAQLGTRDIGFQGFELGATATLENYRSWNITPDGLMITFDEYQVAPYAAGPQTVVIPYQELASILQPSGPLSAYVQK